MNGVVVEVSWCATTSLSSFLEVAAPLLTHVTDAPARPIDQFGPEDSAAHGTPHQLTLSVDSNAIRLLVLLAKNIGKAVTTVSGKNTGEVNEREG
jgi:hypothetical protein